MRLNDLFEKYLDDIDLTHQDTTIDSIKYRYNSHIKNIFGEMELTQITYVTIILSASSPSAIRLSTILPADPN